LKSKLRTNDTNKTFRKYLKDSNKNIHTDLSKLNKEIENTHNSVVLRLKDSLKDTSKPCKIIVETDKDKTIKSIKKLK